eukprot:5492234-Pleurochrysis_carterae.AAC.2
MLPSASANTRLCICPLRVSKSTRCVSEVTLRTARIAASHHSAALCSHPPHASATGDEMGSVARAITCQAPSEPSVAQTAFTALPPASSAIIESGIDTEG